MGDRRCRPLCCLQYPVWWPSGMCTVTWTRPVAPFAWLGPPTRATAGLADSLWSSRSFPCLFLPSLLLPLSFACFFPLQALLCPLL